MNKMNKMKEIRKIIDVTSMSGTGSEVIGISNLSALKKICKGDVKKSRWHSRSFSW